MIPVPKIEPFFGLRGLDLGSELRLTKKTLVLLAFQRDLLMQVKVSTKVIWGGVGTRFPHPERELNDVGVFISIIIMN